MGDIGPEVAHYEVLPLVEDEPARVETLPEPEVATDAERESVR